jgi:hypothetical protein
MTVAQHAYAELVDAGLHDTMIADHVLELARTYDAQRHNDGSRVIDVFTRVAAGLPLTHLLGGDDEWWPPLNGIEQNKRCASVFRDATGQAYDTMAFVFENPTTGARHVSERSHLKVTFPYYPRPRIVQMSPPGAVDGPLPVAGQPAPEIE